MKSKKKQASKGKEKEKEKVEKKLHQIQKIHFEEPRLT